MRFKMTLGSLSAALIWLAGVATTQSADYLEPEILAYEEQDRLFPPAKGAIIVTGSSTINWWYSMRNDLAPLDIIPRGFGGSTAADLDYYLERIVLKYEPRAVVIYEGDNDLAWGATPEQIAVRISQIAGRIFLRFPTARVYVISVKPSLLRWNLWPQMQQTNRLLSEFCAGDPRCQYIDTSSVLLGADGLPRPDYYASDALHLNAAGYAAWTSAVRPVLMESEQSSIGVPTLQGQDIGAVGSSGSFGESGGVLTVRGSGVDIWGTSDEFQYAWLPLDGDGQITARLVSQTNTATWAKAGVMLREQLSPTSRHAFMLVTPAAGSHLLYRTLTGGTTGPSLSIQPGISTPYWIRLVREGNLVAGYDSPDGIKWIKRGSVTFSSLANSTYAGLAVSSTNDGVLSTALFDNVFVFGSTSPPPPPVIDVTPPSVPTGLQAIASGPSQADLSWNTSSDNGSGVSGYRIFRDGVPLATTATTSYVDTGLVANTLYTFSVSAYDGASPPNESAQSAAVSVTTPATSGTALRINAGSSSAYVDVQGRVWSADTGFNTGVASFNSNAIAGTEDDVLYRSERWDRATAPELRYSLSVPNGTYEVRLHFAENYTGAMAVGARVFDVDIEGVRVFNDLDIFATVGARTALIRSATTSVSDGRLDIDFLHQTEDPLVNAIEIIGASSVPDTTPPSVPTGLAATASGTSQVNLSWNASTDNVGVAGYRVYRNGTAVGTVTTTSYSDTGLAANTLYTYRVSAYDGASPANESAQSVAASVTTPSTSSTALHINTGSTSAYVDGQGRLWAGDTGFNTGVMAPNTNAIAGTVDDVLYQSERYDKSTAPELRYSLAVPNGTYEVRLHFAENYTGTMAVGARVFDVNIEGVRVFNDLDIFATVGARTALIRSATTSVSDGRLDIDFLHQTENPLVNAIEIIGTSVPDTTAPSVPTGLVASAVNANQVNLAWNASTDNVGVAGYRVFRNGTAVGTSATTSYSDTGLAANTLHTYTVSAYDGASPPNESLPSTAASATTPATSTTVLRINTGSASAYIDGQGRTWSADTGFNTGVASFNSNAIAGTVDDVLYQSERWDRAIAPELRYSLALPNGTYEVRLHFAENYTGAMTVGARVFDVNIEGVRVFENIDVFATAGARTALVRSATTTVSDGRLDIDFLHQSEDPMVNAIEIIGISN